jgi:hypothetical protein
LKQKWIEDEDEEEDEYEPEAELIKGKVVSASEIAKYVCGEPNGTEEGKAFGKVFEEGYCNLVYIMNSRRDYDEIGITFFHAHEQDFFVLDQILSLCDLLTFIAENFGFGDSNTQRMVLAFLDANIEGKIPKTQFRKWKEGYYISAKPDLEKSEWKSEYIEFKTYPISEYAVTQCLVFAFVLQSDIRLIGWKEGKVEERTVTKQEGKAFMDSLVIPDELFHESEFSEDRIPF